MEIMIPKMPETNDIAVLKAYIKKLSELFTFFMESLDRPQENPSFEELYKLSFRLDELENRLDYSFNKTADGSGVLRLGDVTFSFGSASVSSGSSIGVALSPLNIRSGRGTEHSIIGLIPQYREAKVLSIENGWAEVEYGGIRGFSSTDYLNIKTESGGVLTIPFGTIFLEKPAVFLSSENPSVRLMETTNATITVSSETQCSISFLAVGR